MEASLFHTLKISFLGYLILETELVGTGHSNELIKSAARLFLNITVIHKCLNKGWISKSLLLYILLELSWNELDFLRQDR